MPTGFCRAGSLALLQALTRLTLLSLEGNRISALPEGQYLTGALLPRFAAVPQQPCVLALALARACSRQTLRAPLLPVPLPGRPPVAQPGL